ncbi:MAG: hypothetical protein KAY11_14420 [Ilumatobacteraceae bacterium]|nr:hypothetical protein [Ilumatobacteraceae bacterium]
MRVGRRCALLIAITALCATSFEAPAHAADQNPPFIPAAADWLTTVNYYREMAGVAPVAEDTSMSPGAYNHSCYMLLNDIAHDEVPGAPGYTAAGDTAGNNGNVAVSSATSVTQRSFVELWMTGPFHAIGMLRPNLQRVGYGQCENASTARWHSGATLDILRGLGQRRSLSAPILFPGNGTVTNLTKFIAESPNPVQMCGWGTTGAGLPVIAMMPEGFSANPTASMTGPSGPIETCVLSRHNTTGSAQSILQGDNAAVVMPRSPLTAGVYTVSVTTSARSVNWSFTVDPSASDSVAAAGPPPAAGPTSGPNGWEPIPQARFVDSRIANGATKLLAGVTKRIRLTGRLGLPTDATAISGNFTVVNPAGAGFLTVWNCSNPTPVVSTLNFGNGEAVSNAATTPLDSSGDVCLFSPVDADILIDVSGYYSAAATSRFAAVVPERVLDTRSSGRLAGGVVLELPLPAAPQGATGAMLNVTSINPDGLGFVTVYPCGDIPPTSSVNPAGGEVRPNTVTTALSSNRSVCVYSSTGVDLIVDVFGYMVPSSATGFTPSAPFRWVDTRVKWSAEVNFGTGGQRLGAGQVITIQVAGQRGVPSSATAVSFNITATDGADNNGYITAYPCGSQAPTSNLNFNAGKAVANGAMVALSAGGSLCVYSSVSAHAIIDINGWWG